MINEVGSVPYHRLIQTLCSVPYSNNSGCPNLNRTEVCSGRRPLIDSILNFNHPIHVIITPFDIGGFIRDKIQRREASGEIVTRREFPKPTSGKTKDFLQRIETRLVAELPEWETNGWIPEFSWEREKYEAPTGVSNIRWWQPIARKQHEIEVQNYLSTHPECVVDRYPEGHGVNITAVMKEYCGINLDWRWPLPENVDFTYRVSLAGQPLLQEEGGLSIDEYNRNGIYYLESLDP